MGVARLSWVTGVAVFLCALAGTAGAAAELTARDKADVARAEAYLNGVRTLRAQFIQTTSNGDFSEGRLYLQRPGLLRLDYLPPAQLQIFADGTWLIYVDTELNQVNQVPLGATPAGVLVDETVRLSGDLKVVRVERGRQSFRLHVVRTDEPDSGSLILAFQDRPMMLKHWIVVDSQGVRTRVALVNPEFNVAIDNKVFAFERPDPGAFDQ